MSFPGGPTEVGGGKQIKDVKSISGQVCSPYDRPKKKPKIAFFFVFFT